VLTVGTLVGLIFLDTSPAAPPENVVTLNSLDARLTAVEAKTAPIFVAGDDFVVQGKNVHIVDGSGFTYSDSGIGNLTIGYNELRTNDTIFRTGTHNPISATYHNYSSFGGPGAGQLNEISGDYAVVCGGAANTASGLVAVVSGGSHNNATGRLASVSGGTFNTASGFATSVSGGRPIRASGEEAAVSGGFSNEASYFQSSISGGVNNEASGQFSAVSGGADNVASGTSSTVSGGRFRTATDFYDWAAGSLFEDQ
jgi:hypothetical protein